MEDIMKWIPDKDWWLTPSGGPYSKPWTLATILTEAPLPAHMIGAALIAIGFLPLFLSVVPLLGWVITWQFKFWWACVLVMAFWQGIVFEHHDWYSYPPYQMVWRVLIGAVPLGLLVWLLA